MNSFILSVDIYLTFTAAAVCARNVCAAILFICYSVDLGRGEKWRKKDGKKKKNLNEKKRKKRKKNQSNFARLSIAWKTTEHMSQYG